MFLTGGHIFMDNMYVKSLAEYTTNFINIGNVFPSKGSQNMQLDPEIETTTVLKLTIRLGTRNTSHLISFSIGGQIIAFLPE